MLAFVFCGALGAVQTAFLNKVLKGTLGGKLKDTVVWLLFKLLTYAVGFAVLYFFFFDDIFYAGAGFIVGVTVSFAIVAVKSIGSLKAKNSSKGDEADGHVGAD